MSGDVDLSSVSSVVEDSDADVSGSETLSGIKDTQVSTDTSSTTPKHLQDDDGGRNRHDTYDTVQDVGEPSRSDSTDEVDVRRLVDEPTVSDIRWLYRNTFAKTIIEKPIDDAFKHGFTVQNSNSNSSIVRDLLDDTKYIQQHKLAMKKARRDGFALLYFILEDSTAGPEEPVSRSTFNDIEKINVFSIDDLMHVGAGEIEDAVPDGFGRRDRTPLTEEDTVGTNNGFNYVVRKTGAVVSRRLDDSSWNETIGYVVDLDRDGTKPRFVHGDRFQEFVHSPEVDGDYRLDRNSMYDHIRGHGEWAGVPADRQVMGHVEGDSALMPVYHLIKSVFKGNWAVMQTLFRYASPFYSLNLAENDGEEELQQAQDMFQNLNAKAEGVFPADWDIEMHDSDGGIDPESYFDPIFDQICAGTEMTKSVLFGTQAGTVSGSETDAQTYYNQVQRNQENLHADKIHEFVRMVSRWDTSKVPPFVLGFTIDWNPIFELSLLEKGERVRTLIQAVVQAQSAAYITPDEGREFLRELLEDYEVEFEGELSPDDFELLEQIELAQQGAGQLSRQEGGGDQESKMSGNNSPPGQTPNEGTNDPDMAGGQA